MSVILHFIVEPRQIEAVEDIVFFDFTEVFIAFRSEKPRDPLHVEYLQYAVIFVLLRVHTELKGNEVSLTSRTRIRRHTLSNPSPSLLRFPPLFKESMSIFFFYFPIFSALLVD